MVGTQDLIYEDKSLKLQLRLAQLEKNEACQKDFLTFCAYGLARVYCRAPS